MDEKKYHLKKSTAEKTTAVLRGALTSFPKLEKEKGRKEKRREEEKKKKKKKR